MSYTQKAAPLIRDLDPRSYSYGMPDERTKSPDSVLPRFVLEFLPEPIIVLDAAGLVVETNLAAREIQYSPLLELFEPDRIADSTRRFLAELRDRGRGALVVARPNTSGHLVLEGFSVEHYVVIRARDASYERALHDLKKEISHLRQAESLGLMAATVIHDLNNLLTPMMCFSSALASEVQGSQTIAPLVADVESLATRAAALTRDALAVARPRGRGLEALNLSEVITELRPLIERLFGANAEIMFALDEGLGETRAERARLEHALLNLLANSRNAMPHGGRVTITTANAALTCDHKVSKGPSRYVVLSVSDTGVGMSEEVGAHAFDEFFTTRDGSGGTGLGLASVKRFVTEHGGFVRLESELGLGTTVSICLPRVESRKRTDS
ncbi:MAG TPA: ATP-binding protein [Polyangiaceae bacterium]|nr:ATP-binding protein [Polyangiaceae bacterium]